MKLQYYVWKFVFQVSSDNLCVQTITSPLAIGTQPHEVHEIDYDGNTIVVSTTNMQKETSHL